MSLKLVLIGCLAVVLPAAAQLDSAALRAKFGSPLNRETFHMPAGFDLTVDYGSQQVCKLAVPALMPSNEKVSNTDVMRARMYDFLWEVVPPAMRGRELRRMASQMGAISVVSIEYEHVTVSELHSADPFQNTITITFVCGAGISACPAC